MPVERAKETAMRILYGVTGEGLGHAMRSRVVAQHLYQRGHEVKLVASGRARDYLARYFPDVERIPGFAMEYREGRVARGPTVRRTLRAMRPAVRESVAMYRTAISGWQPDVCVSDFDSFSHVFGRLFGRPVISLDHQHVIDRCEHPMRVRDRLPEDFVLTKAFVRAKMPGCAHYVVTSFYRPPAKPRCRERTTVVGPILRPEVMALEPTNGEHVLVYQTGVPTAELIAVLHAAGAVPFVLYARDATDAVLGNVTIRAFDEARFLADLASARAVICNGGYTLMSEALYLGKPIASLPLRHQGEQELNAAYLDELGLGLAMRRLDTSALRAFVRAAAPIARLPAGNLRAFATIDRLLGEVV
jgi:uncharacterized protein (TIGR00661 family)